MGRETKAITGVRLVGTVRTSEDQRNRWDAAGVWFARNAGLVHSPRGQRQPVLISWTPSSSSDAPAPLINYRTCRDESAW